jgi:hypothetical protein
MSFATPPNKLFLGIIIGLLLLPPAVGDEPPTGRLCAFPHSKAAFVQIPGCSADLLFVLLAHDPFPLTISIP